MSIELVEDSTSIVALPGDGELVISVDPVFGVFELLHGASTAQSLQVALDAPSLIDRILESTCVMIDSVDDAPPLALGVRDDSASDSEWLTHVATTLIAWTSQITLARQVVELALGRVLGTTVTLARRPKEDPREPGNRAVWFTGHDAGRLFGAASSRGRAGRATSGREICFFESRHDWWTVVVPWRASRVDAQAVCQQPLLEAFAGKLQREADLRTPSLPQAALQTLVNAATTGDAPVFVATVAGLVRGQANLSDRDGQLVASADGRPTDRHHHAPPPRTRDIVLRGDDGILGALSLPDTAALSADLADLLGCLGTSLARSMITSRECSLLESRLLVLGCLAPEDDHWLWADSRDRPTTSRRLVLITTTRSMSANETDRLLNRILRAGAEHELLAGLHLMSSGDGLMGLYPDTAPTIKSHEAAWTGVLKSVDHEGSVRIAVGTSVSTAAAAREQYRAVMQLSRVQASGSRYFALAEVAMMDQLGPLADLLVKIPGQQLAPFVERVLGSLLDDQRFGGQLLETLYAYLQTGGSPREAGGILHLHASTVKYRMRVIRELLGERLDDQSARFDLELAVRLCLASRRIVGGRTK